MVYVREATADTVDSRAVPLLAVVPFLEVLTQVAHALAVVPSQVDHAVVVHTQVVLTVEALMVAEVTSEATDNEGYNSSVRTSAFDIL